MKWKNPNFSSSDQHQYMCNINRKLEGKKKKKKFTKTSVTKKRRIFYYKI